MSVCDGPFEEKKNCEQIWGVAVWVCVCMESSVCACVTTKEMALVGWI